MDTKENNKVKITGKVVSNFQFSHDFYGEKFYTVMLEVKRLSDSTDTIPVSVSERIVDVSKDCIGQYVNVTGQFRSYNQKDGAEQKRKLILSVFARDFEFCDEEPDGTGDTNTIELEGYVCKEVDYRQTPLGREIADILVAVNRRYNKSDYIPCICWGRNAKYAEQIEIGTHIKACGRIQSRNYIKRIDDTTEERVAYEVSLSRIETVIDEPLENEAGDSEQADSSED